MAPSHLHRGAAKRCCSTSAPAVRSACRTAERMPSQPRTRSAWRPDASFDMYLLHGSVGKVGGLRGKLGKWLSKWILEKWILVSFAHLNKAAEFKSQYLEEQMFHSVFEVWNGLKPTCEAGKQTDIVEFRSLLALQGITVWPTKPNTFWTDKALIGLLGLTFYRPTLVLFLPAKHLWMCGVITCTLVFLHLFKPLVRISSDQLPRDANSNAEKKLVHHPTLPKLFGKPQCSVASSHYLHRTWVWSICIQSKSHSTTHASRVKKME